MIVWVIAALWAAPAAGESICFSEDVAARMAVEIEQCRLMTAENALYAQAAAELKRQLGIQQELTGACEAQFAAAETAIGEARAREALEKKACDARVKAVEPSRLQSLFRVLGSVGVGVLIGAALMLL